MDMGHGWCSIGIYKARGLQYHSYYYFHLRVFVVNYHECMVVLKREEDEWY